jgi:hypothetical protein
MLDNQAYVDLNREMWARKGVLMPEELKEQVRFSA